MSHRKTGHPHHIWKSIMDTPQILEACLSKQVQDQVEHVADQIASLQPQRVLFSGTGSSGYAGIAHAHAFEQIATLPASWHVTTELGAYPPLTLGPESVLIITSHSGRTPGDLPVVKLARERGAYTVGITDIQESPLAQIVDDTIIGPGGPKVEMPATRTYDAAMFRVFELATAIAQRMGHEEAAFQYEQALTQMPRILRRFLDEFSSRAPLVAQDLADCSAYFVISAGPNMSTAYEGALALLQSTGVAAQGFYVEEILHGAIQALTAQMCMVAIAAPGPLQARILQVAQAARIIGARVVTIAPVGIEPLGADDLSILMPSDVPELFTPLLYIAPLWQIGYYFSLLTGRDPDHLSMHKPEFKKAFAFLMPHGSKFDKLVGRQS